jgi:hypothetical protein
LIFGVRFLIISGVPGRLELRRKDDTLEGEILSVWGVSCKLLRDSLPTIQNPDLLAAAGVSFMRDRMQNFDRNF